MSLDSTFLAKEVIDCITRYDATKTECAFLKTLSCIDIRPVKPYPNRSASSSVLNCTGQYPKIENCWLPVDYRIDGRRQTNILPRRPELILLWSSHSFRRMTSRSSWIRRVGPSSSSHRPMGSHVEQFLRSLRIHHQETAPFIRENSVVCYPARFHKFDPRWAKIIFCTGTALIGSKLSLTTISTWNFKQSHLVDCSVPRILITSHPTIAKKGIRNIGKGEDIP